MELPLCRTPSPMSKTLYLLFVLFLHCTAIQSVVASVYDDTELESFVTTESHSSSVPFRFRGTHYASTPLPGRRIPIETEEMLFCGFDAAADDPNERQALLDVYAAVQGNKWNLWPRHQNTSLSLCCWDVASISCSLNQHVALLHILVPHIVESDMDSGQMHIPKSVEKLQYLEMFSVGSLGDLSHVIPLQYIAEGAFNKLQFLRTFQLFSTAITNLDHVLPEGVVDVYLYNNPITSINGLDDLTSVQNLYLNSNPGIFRDRFPNWMKMTNLTILSLEGNGLTALCEAERISPTPPGQDSVCELPATLKALDVSNNNLTALPVLCMIDPDAITVLRFSYNQIPYFRECWCHIYTNQRVSRSMFPNPISTLPDCFFDLPIVNLYLSSPVMEVLPVGIGRMESLNYLKIVDMPLLTWIPLEIFAARYLVSVEVRNAPLLSRLPDISGARGVRNILFDDVGMHEIHILSPAFFAPVQSFGVINSPLDTVSVDIRVRNAFIGSSLSFRNCNISLLDSHTLTALSEAKSLDLSGNPLDQLEEHIAVANLWVNNTSIRVLTVSGERVDASNIQTLESTHITSYRPQGMSEVNLTGSDISRLPYLILDAHEASVQPDVVNNAPTVYEEVGLTCYPVFLTPQSRLVTEARMIIDPSQIQYEHCRCIALNMYFVPAENQNTSDSLPSRCEYLETSLISKLTVSYNDSVSRPTSYVNPGFYPVTTASNHAGLNARLQYCDKGTGLLQTCQYLECIYPSRCNPYRVSPFQCHGGYDEESLLCSDCPDNYYDTSTGGCKPCPEQAMVLVSVYSIVAFVVLFVYLWFAHSRDYSHRHGYSSVSIFIGWLQIVYILMRISHTSAVVRTNESDNSIAAVLHFISSFFYHIQPTSLSCIVPDYDYISRWWVTMLSPLILTALCGVFFVAVSLLHGRYSYMLSFVIYVHVFVVQGLYISVASCVFEIFNCVDAGLGDLTYLSAYPPLDCASDTYSHMKWMGVCGVFVYVIGIPLSFASLIYYGNTKRLNDQSLLSGQSRHLSSLLEDEEPVIGGDRSHHNPHIPYSTMAGSSNADEVIVDSNRQDIKENGSPDQVSFRERNNVPLLYGLSISALSASYRMLASPYRPHMSYWTIASIMVRKCLIAATVALFVARQAMIPFIILIVLMLSLFIHIHVHPYYHVFDNTLESLCLSLSGITFLSGIFISSENLLGTQLILDATIIINIIAFLSFVIGLPLVRLNRCPRSVIAFFKHLGK